MANLVMGASGAVPSATPDAASPFGYHPASISSGPHSGGSFSKAHDLGIRWNRGSLYAYWFLVQKNLDSASYDFEELDRQFRAVPPDICILANIAPQGNVDEGRCKPGSWIPVDVEKYAAFVRETVERYDGDGVHDMPGLVNPIHCWQVGNEPDMPQPGGPTRTDFWALQRITYEAIKSADPRATVLLAGIGGGSPEGFLHSFDECYSPLLHKLAGKYVDVVDFHWYLGLAGDYRLREAGSGRDVLGHIRSTLKDSGFPDGFPIWATEMGACSGQPKAGPPAEFQSEWQQATGYFKMFVYALSHGVGKVFGAWGLMEGQMSGGEHFFDLTGIIYDGKGSHDPGAGTKKLAYYSYKKMTEKLEKVDWAGAIPITEESDGGATWIFRLQRNGKPMFVAWQDFTEHSPPDKGAEKPVKIDSVAGTSVVVTEAIPSASSGREVKSYRGAFRVTRHPVKDGSVVVPLGLNPVYIEVQE